MSQKLNRMKNSVRTGGKGSVRRRKLVRRKNTTTDDKRLQAALKRLGVNQIPGIEEVNIFNQDGTVLQFKSNSNLKVQANVLANTYVVSGKPENKLIQDLLPGIINQLGDNMGLQKLAEQVSLPTDKVEDEDIPQLVGENFEDTANKDQKKQENADTSVPPLTPADNTSEPPPLIPADTTSPVITT